MTASAPAPLSVAVVAPIAVRNDAISQAAVDTARLFASVPGLSATLITTYCEHDGAPAHIAPDLGALLRAAPFLAADLIVYHFGIHHAYFDALTVGNGRARQVVRFHNVTPSRLLRPEDAPVIERSLRQMGNFRWADRIWADSPFNAESLLEAGIDSPPTEVIPLLVDGPARRSLRDKTAPLVEILYVGRFVRSKGVLDLIEALGIARARGAPAARLRLCGNQAFSDPAYLAAVRAAAGRLDVAVEFMGAVDDASRDALLRSAHILAIPSYHEGFCKPVVEGLRAGCAPVGYRSGNLPSVAAGLGRLVPTGDVAALGEALASLCGAMAGVARGERGVALPLDRGTLDLAAFDAAVDRHVAGFEWRAVLRRTVLAAATLLVDGEPPAPRRAGTGPREDPWA